MKKLIIICILSIIAFFNATYLTYQNNLIEKASEKWQISSFCDINNTFSCTNVLSSPYSKVFDLPFTAIAMVVYPIIFLIAFLGISWIIKKPYHILSVMWIGWITFNSYFILQEILYIKAFCPLCLICTAIIISIFIISLIWILQKPKLTFWERIKTKIK